MTEVVIMKHFELLGGKEPKKKNQVSGYFVFVSH